MEFSYGWFILCTRFLDLAVWHHCEQGGLVQQRKGMVRYSSLRSGPGKALNKCGTINNSVKTVTSFSILALRQRHLYARLVIQ
jgi:hypothetical protein